MAPQDKSKTTTPEAERQTRVEPTVPDAPEGAPSTGGAGEHNPFVHQLLLQAKGLRDEKKGYLERVEANRSTLRQVAKTGLLSEDQGKAIEAFYPPNTRKQNQPQGEEA
jgi:hypothetical protein